MGSLPGETRLGRCDAYSSGALADTCYTSLTANRSERSTFSLAFVDYSYLTKTTLINGHVYDMYPKQPARFRSVSASPTECSSFNVDILCVSLLVTILMRVRIGSLIFARVCGGGRTGGRAEPRGGNRILGRICGTNLCKLRCSFLLLVTRLCVYVAVSKFTIICTMCRT